MPRRFEDNYCVKCGALDIEVAREGCGNPTWHADPPPPPRQPIPLREPKAD